MFLVFFFSDIARYVSACVAGILRTLFIKELKQADLTCKDRV